MSRMRILEEWNSFRREVIPDTSPEAAAMLQKIFYAGVMAMMNIFLISGDELEIAQVFTNLRKELSLFNEKTRDDATNS